MKSWWGGGGVRLPLREDGPRDQPRVGQDLGAVAQAPEQAEQPGVVLQGVELLQPVDGADHGHVLRLRFHGEALEVGQRLGGFGAVQEPPGVAGEAEEAPAHALKVVDGQQVPHEEVAVAAHAPRQLWTVVDGVGGIEKRFHALPRG